jgi:purine-nucleoside phosphorylase
MLSPDDIAGRAAEAASFLRERSGPAPSMALVLGTGWDALLQDCTCSPPLSFDSVPGFKSTGVEGHAGHVRMAETAGGARLLVQEGRLHCYEGNTPLEVSFPVWAYHALGVKVLVMLSAAGGLNPAYLPGDLIIVTDHIYLWGPNPLAGLADVPGRTRFMPGHEMYSGRWQEALKACLPEDARVESGVYAYVSGPSFETPAEARFLRVAGADVVGMSTAPEAIAARYLGLEVASMVCVSNSLLPPSGAPPSHEMVLEVVRRTASGLGGFLDSLAAREDMVL